MSINSTDTTDSPSSVVNAVVDRCKSVLADGWSGWREFWFKPADPLMLGVIRILTGLMLTYNLLVWGLDLQAFFGAESLQPVNAIRSIYASEYVFSFLLYVPDEWLVPVHWSCVAIALLFAAGVSTRVTAALGFLIAISYSQRVPVANFGLDQILGMLCLYMAIGPSGTCLSVDSWWRNRRTTGKGLKLSVPKLPSARTTLRLIQIHICIIYFWAGFAKLKGDSWWTGEAMWQVIANEEYQTIDLTWMAYVPWLPYLLAHVTVAWEVSFCILVWKPRWRPIMLGVGTLMHMGIGAFLGMWTFGLVMTFPYFAFARPSRWRRRLALWRQGEDEQVELEQPQTEEAPVVEKQAKIRLHEELQEPLPDEAVSVPTTDFDQAEPQEAPVADQQAEIPLNAEQPEQLPEDVAVPAAEFASEASAEDDLSANTTDADSERWLSKAVTPDSTASEGHRTGDDELELQTAAGQEFGLETSGSEESPASAEPHDEVISASEFNADTLHGDSAGSEAVAETPDPVEAAAKDESSLAATEEFTSPPQISETSHAVQTLVSDQLTDASEISAEAEESMIQPLAATAESTMAENDDTKNDSDSSSSTLSVADMLKSLPEPPVVIDRRTNGVPPAVPDEEVTSDGETIVHVMDDDNYVVGATAYETSEEADDSPAEPQIIEPVSAAATPSDNISSDGRSADEPDTNLFNSGAEMTDNTNNTEGKNEISTSRMERIKPKSANSLTGAPPPQVDGHVEDSVLAPESEVLLVALHAPERNTFRTYLRKHDIPCRAAMSAENAVSIVLGMKPAAVLLSGSCMNPEEILTLIDDINDMVDAPVLALLTLSQINHLSNDALSAHVLQYPASLRQVREELTLILMEEGNAKPRCSLRTALANNE